MPYINIRVEFEEENNHYEPSVVSFRGSDIPEEFLEGIADSAFQSDVYTFCVANAVLEALGGGSVIVD